MLYFYLYGVVGIMLLLYPILLVWPEKWLELPSNISSERAKDYFDNQIYDKKNFFITSIIAFFITIVVAIIWPALVVYGTLFVLLMKIKNIFNVEEFLKKEPNDVEELVKIDKGNQAPMSWYTKPPSKINEYSSRI